MILIILNSFPEYWILEGNNYQVNRELHSNNYDQEWLRSRWGVFPINWRLLMRHKNTSCRPPWVNTNPFTNQHLLHQTWHQYSFLSCVYVQLISSRDSVWKCYPQTPTKCYRRKRDMPRCSIPHWSPTTRSACVGGSWPISSCPSWTTWHPIRPSSPPEPTFSSPPTPSSPVNMSDPAATFSRDLF